MSYINQQFLLNKRPIGMPEDDCWVIDKEFISSIANGEILIKVEYLSIDPYMRGRMNDGVSYASPVKIGELMVGETVGTVIESKSKLFGSRLLAALERIASQAKKLDTWRFVG